jgi:hypothetical protein
MITLFFDNSMYDLPEYHFDVPIFLFALVSFAIVYEGIMFVYTKKIKGIPLKEVMAED